MTNAASLCFFHHALVHEGGYTIQHIDSSEQRLNEQLARQQRADDKSMFDFEKELRNDRESFDRVRKLSPTSYRFRVVDADGNDIRSTQSTNDNNSQTYSTTEYKSSDSSFHCTRVECAEPFMDYYHYPIGEKCNVSEVALIIH